MDLVLVLWHRKYQITSNLERMTLFGMKCEIWYFSVVPALTTENCRKTQHHRCNFARSQLGPPCSCLFLFNVTSAWLHYRFLCVCCHVSDVMSLFEYLYCIHVKEWVRQKDITESSIYQCPITRHSATKTAYKYCIGSGYDLKLVASITAKCYLFISTFEPALFSVASSSSCFRMIIVLLSNEAYWYCRGWLRSAMYTFLIVTVEHYYQSRHDLVLRRVKPGGVSASECGEK
jgi:hypothetical protein